MKEEEARFIARMIVDVLENPNDEVKIAKVKAEVLKLAKNSRYIKYNFYNYIKVIYLRL